MVYISATEAAKRLGVSEKTIRRWIQERRLAAFHPHGYKNRLAIAETDVEAKARELAEYQQPAHEQGPGPASEDITKRLEKAEHWISDIQRWLDALDARIDALEQVVSNLPGLNGEASFLPLQTQPEPTRKRGRPVGSGKVEIPQELPSGSLLLKDFAERHGLAERTARDQVDRSKIDAYVRVKPNRPDSKERWLEPSHQRAAIAFWQSHKTPGFRTCPECPHKQEKE